MAAEPGTEANVPRQSDHGGRGIGIIGAIAETWGVEPNEGGKVVWARFRRPPHGAASSSDPDGRQLPAAP